MKLWLIIGAAFLFTPNIPFMSKPKRKAPFFGLQDRMPVVLALLLGFQHGKYTYEASRNLLFSTFKSLASFNLLPAALAMLAGIITPPIIISGSANFDAKTEQYLVSTSLSKSSIIPKFPVQ